jgi:predicted nuclease with TOPRIM domain
MAVDDKFLITLLTNFKDEIVRSVDHRMGIAQEDIQHKLDLVVEGQQSLGERMDRLEGRMDGLGDRMDRVEVKVTALETKVDTLEKKLDGVAADLSAHRCDTEAHRKGWRVREE